jgi:hypothetical protein
LLINQILTQKWFFTSEHKRFIIESYFRDGVFNNGEWTYSAVACLAEFRQNFPNFTFLEADFFNLLGNTIRVFRETGSVEHKKAAGRPTDAVANVSQQMENKLGKNE